MLRPTAARRNQESRKIPAERSKKAPRIPLVTVCPRALNCVMCLDRKPGAAGPAGKVRSKSKLFFRLIANWFLAPQSPTAASPSPRPSPCGRGSRQGRLDTIITRPLSPPRGRRFTLSPRERAGVRGKAMDDLFDPASSIGRPALFSSHAMPHRAGGFFPISDAGFSPVVSALELL